MTQLLIELVASLYISQRAPFSVSVASVSEAGVMRPWPLIAAMLTRLVAVVRLRLLYDRVSVLVDGDSILKV